MCHSCIRRSFKLSLHDPQSMPPKCCTSHIPINVVERLFDTNFKRQWNNKLAEYSTRNRIYCPSRRCDEWIRPEDIRREDGRKYAKCSRCKTKVCCHCGNKWHSSRECPRDEDTSQLLEQAKREGWQRCHRCKYVVELKEGCNHMTCRCGAEFCMICGTKWKRCECPWFNFDTQESDPLDHMQVPMTPRSNPFASGTRFPPTGSGPPSPREFRTDSGPPPPHAVRPRPVNYEEEMLLRRLQEQRDEKVARRARTFGGFSGHEEPEDYSRGRDYSRHRGDAMDREVHPGRSVAEEYHRRPETVIVPSPPLTHQPTAPPAPHSTFDRSNSGLDYVSGVSRARGMRYVSPERRYASPERYHASSPERRQPHTPDIWQSQSRNPSRNASRPPSAERRPPLAAETWPAPSIERRRYASPERSRPPSAEKRRAPERPRTSSLERRLAGRFGNTDSRQTAATTVGLMGPVASMSHVGIMGPVAVMEPMGVMSSTRAPPPPSRAATHPLGPPLPQAPAPPPAVPMVPTSRRKPIGEEDVYVSSRHARSAEWPVTPGRAHQEPEGTSGSPHAPSVKRRPPKANRVHKQDGPTASMLAGISGPGRGPDRVTEWRLYVEPGEPEGKESPAVS
ncbi:hypothetical protein B0T26DRAFT_206367 [Lasiosphaeria miniovina]|uniref:RBR-type E3 ubiquitin transferase n=1 Tax=Lasiosphaeria miniovina TaxID=1954250 RepID=A0AA40E246_9PEZI|nr:uncharacterized protein B0T26DRAFT_206367 [Lasiosphaeria miniovina]KAK0722182.1 hypothetical protein B0T26DRAFT_206367 [Lasiosphaeria miniovina]